MPSETYTPDNLIFGLLPVSTDSVKIPSGTGTVARGMVLGVTQYVVPTTGTADGSNTGNGTCTAVVGNKKTMSGIYTIKCTSAITNSGQFRLTNPNGKFIADILITAGAGGTGVLVSNELNLTLTDGSTDFALDDFFTVTVTSGIPATGTADGGNTGNGTLTLVIGQKNIKAGAYIVTCITEVTNGGIFSVVDPDGITLDPATVGASYDNDFISFILNDGSTDFAAADFFTITVTIEARQCVPVNSSLTSGAQVPKYVNLKAIDATSVDVFTVGAKTGSFNERSLTFGGTDTIETHREAMREIGLQTGLSEKAIV